MEFVIKFILVLIITVPFTLIYYFIKFYNLKDNFDNSEEHILSLQSKLQSKLQELKSLEKYKTIQDAEGEALKIKKTIQAIKNIINGYGNEYLIPSHSVLDDLAQEYNHKQAGKDLKETRKLIRQSIRNQQTTFSDYRHKSKSKHNSVRCL
jgi:cell division protein FtsL